MEQRHWEYARLFAALPSPHLAVTPDLVVVDVNAAYLALVGLERSALVGRPLFEVFPPTADAVDETGEPRLVRSFRRVLASGRPDPSFVERYDVADPATGVPTERYWSHVVVPVLDDAGDVELLVQRVDEVTDYVRAREAAAGQLDGPSTRSPLEAMQAELYARSLEVQAAREAEHRTSRVLEAMPSGFLSMDTRWRFTLVNAAAEEILGRRRAELLGRPLWGAYPGTVGNEFEEAYRAAVETGVPRTLEAWYPAPLDKWFEILCWPSPDGLSLYFADVTARRRAAERADRATARLALLARVNADLVGALDVSATIAQLPRALVPALGDACVVSLVEDGGRVRDVGWEHQDAELRAALGRYVAVRMESLPLDSPFARVLHTGRAEHLSAAELAAVSLSRATRSRFDRLGLTSAVLLPIRGRGTTIGVLTLFRSTGRAADPETDATAQDVADRIGLALDNARLSTAQAQLAEALQRSLLTDPPQPDHGQIVVRYVPATEAARVGGDWYDAFVQPGGTTMLVIGDVAGHDTAAAATMGQLRGLLRGIATYSAAGPAEVLRGLDSSMESLMVQTLATAAVARFGQTAEEVERGVTRMTWASAGHPPPLVVDGDGAVEVLGGWRGDLLLGVDPTAGRREHELTLERGTTVLLYTDGLVERRDAPLDEGLDRLVEVVAELAGSSLDDLCDGVLERMVHGRPDDDIALVAVRLHRQDLPRPAEAGPNVVPDSAPEPPHPGV